MTVAEIKEKLVLLGVLEEDIKGKNKEALELMLNEIEVVEPDPPQYGKEGWEEYVMSRFKEDELFEGKHPTLNGLRRVANELFGGLTRSAVVKLERNWEGRGSAYCVYEIILHPGVTFHGCGDSTEHNTHEAYSIYPVALAENRAEARAYRKALMLKTVAAEEMKETKNEFTSVLSSTSEYSDNDLMSSQQEIIIKTKCKQQSIDYDLFIKENSSGKPTRKEAIDLISKLNDLQQGR